MADLLQSLAQGLRGAAGVLSPAVQQQTFQQDQRQQELAQQEMIRRRNLAAQQIIKGAEMGAIDPEAAKMQLQRLGFGEIPVGPSVETQARQTAAAREQELRRRLAAATTPEERRAVAMEFASPDRLIQATTEKPVSIGRGGALVPDGQGGWTRIEGSAEERRPLTNNRFPIGGGKVQPHISFDNGRTWEPVPGSQPIDAKAISGSTTVNINPNNPLGVTDKTDLRNVTESTRGKETLIQEMSQFIKDLENTPGAVGLRGAISQPASGVVGQVLGDKAGQLTSKAISGASQENVANLRVQAQLMRGRLLPVVTNETGRFTEAERAIATEALGALDIAQDKTQVKAASQALLQITIGDRERGYKTLGVKPKYNLSTVEGYAAQAKELEKLGLSQKQAADTVDRMIMIRGSR